MSDFGNGVAVDGEPQVTETQAAAPNKELAENLVKLREKGWITPVPFKYDTVKDQSAPDAPTVTAPGAEPDWLGGAAIYQWDDEFGDIGPENPALEEELFRGENLMKAGGAIKALDFDVKVEGGTGRVAPFRDVGSTLPLLISYN